MNIILTGYRGTGKTTIGKIISENLKMEFIDTDDEVERNAGIKIPEIVNKYGWERIRELESKAVNYALKKNNAVIATGAGALVETDLSKEFVKSRAKVVLLKATVECISTRIRDSTRPSITGKGLVEEITEVMKRREQKYMEIADMTIDTTNITAKEAAEKIEKMMRKK